VPLNRDTSANKIAIPDKTNTTPKTRNTVGNWSENLESPSEKLFCKAKVALAGIGCPAKNDDGFNVERPIS